MDGERVDAVAQRLGQRLPRLSRRLALGLGMAGLHGGSPSSARNNSQRRRLQRNSYGCVPVGRHCRGNDDACCSGICRGQKPKKGKKDRSRCVDHDASTCQGRQQSGTCGATLVNCATSAGRDGTCQTTTGNADYCAASVNCFACRRDADCQDRIDTPRAACIRCAGCLGGTTCAFIE